MLCLGAIKIVIVVRTGGSERPCPDALSWLSPNQMQTYYIRIGESYLCLYLVILSIYLSWKSLIICLMLLSSFIFWNAIKRHFYHYPDVMNCPFYLPDHINFVFYLFFILRSIFMTSWQDERFIWFLFSSSVYFFSLLFIEITRQLPSLRRRQLTWLFPGGSW